MIKIDILRPISSSELFVKSGIQYGDFNFGDRNKLHASIDALNCGIKAISGKEIIVDENDPIHRVFDVLVKEFNTIYMRSFPQHNRWQLYNGNVIVQQSIHGEDNLYFLHIANINKLPKPWQKVMEMIISMLVAQENITPFWDLGVIDGYWKESDDPYERKRYKKWNPIIKEQKKRFSNTKFSFSDLTKAFDHARSAEPIYYLLEEVIAGGLEAVLHGITEPPISAHMYSELKSEDGDGLGLDKMICLMMDNEDEIDEFHTETCNDYGGNYGCNWFIFETVINPGQSSITIAPIPKLPGTLLEFINSFESILYKSEWKKKK